jgi:hypothetical protein
MELAMSRHHPTLSPSKFPALSKCPKYESGEVGEAANRGTRIHGMMEAILKGTEPNRDYDHDEVQEAIWAADTVRDLAGGDLVTSENEVSLYDEKGNQITFGTVDAYWTDGVKIHVADLKTGQPRDSWAQMAVYGLALLDDDLTTDRCELHLIYSKTKQIESREFSRSEMEALVYPVIEAVRNGNPPNPCEYCNWCSKVSECPAIKTSLAIAYKSDGMELTDGAVEALKNPTCPQDWSLKVQIANAVLAWATKAKDEAKEHVKAGGVVPGYQIRIQAGNRQIDDVQLAFSLSGLEPHQFLEACKVSITSLESEIATSKGIKKAEAKRYVESMLSSCISRAADKEIFEAVK